MHAIWLAVKAQQANRRQGTAKTKDRWEVRGGGRKPWRQKGRGTARSGSSRSPLWVGGGTIHGPDPHPFDVRIPRKVRQLARRSALSHKLAEKQLRVVEDFSFDAIKTKKMVDVLSAHGLSETKTVFLTAQSNQTLYRSGRNIPTLRILVADKASAFDLLNNKMLLIQKSAIDSLVQMFSKEPAHAA
jgi:large subunit ribosomal protein L4